MLEQILQGKDQKRLFLHWKLKSFPCYFREVIPLKIIKLSESELFFKFGFSCEPVGYYADTGKNLPSTCSNTHSSHIFYDHVIFFQNNVIFRIFTYLEWSRIKFGTNCLKKKTYRRGQLHFSIKEAFLCKTTSHKSQIEVSLPK